MALDAATVQAKKSEITAPGGIFELEEVALDGARYRAYKHAPKTLVDVFAAASPGSAFEKLVQTNLAALEDQVTKATNEAALKWLAANIESLADLAPAVPTILETARLELDRIENDV